MTSRFRRLACVFVGCLVATTGLHPQSASALDTPNTLMGIDGMVLHHFGLFRQSAGIPLDGINTFVFGPVLHVQSTKGRYRSFIFVKNGEGAGGVSHNARFNTNAPEHFNGTNYAPPPAPLDITNVYFPVIDRAAFGQRFDPDQYQIEVKFKPNVGVAGLPDNGANFFQVSLDQAFGYVWDAEENAYNRAGEQIGYNIGSDAAPINAWYASAPKDADGFATYTVPVTMPSFTGRSVGYFDFGNPDFRINHVVTGGGKVLNPDSTWSDVTIGHGPNFTQFGGGVSDPSRPGSKLNTPNGVSFMLFGAPATTANLSLDVKSVALTKITPGPIIARLDANSGITFRFGSGFTRGTTAAPIPVAGDPFGLGYLPIATDQISRFDQTGMTNLFLNMRTPDTAGEEHRFVVRGAPGPQTFDGTNAMVNVRARLTEPLTNPGIAQNLTIVAKDLDGNDTNAVTTPFNVPADPVGADEYTFSMALNQFNTSTFTTVSVPLSSFTLAPFVPTTTATAGSGPFGFTNPGDGSRTDFNLYEFGGLVPGNGGLLRLELEYMEIRLPAAGLAGDFDNDKDVDGNDLLLIQRGLGTTTDAGDLADWRANFGMTAAAAAAAGGVPEPSSALLAVFGLAVLRRRRV